MKDAILDLDLKPGDRARTQRVSVSDTRRIALMDLRISLFLFAILFGASCDALAQSYPVRPIRFVVAVPPGGPADTIARIIGNSLTRSLGQQVIVDNRPGASGNIGANIVAKSAPDGYTLFLGSSSEWMNPGAYDSLPFDPIKDFTPITMVISFPSILAASPSLPVKSIQELITLARSKPDKLRYGSSGVGGMSHLIMELFRSTTNIKMLHVPYKGGGPTRLALLQGEVQVMFSTPGEIIANAQAGGNVKFKPLMVTSHKRLAALPDVPSCDEAGFPEMSVTSWNGVLAPAGMPANLVNSLRAEIVKAVDTAERRAWLNARGMDVTATSPQEFASIILRDYTKWFKFVKDHRIHVD